MDVLDRPPRLDLFPVPVPANPSSLDPATTASASGDFAQALALAPAEAATSPTPVATTVIVAPVATDAPPTLPIDGEADESFDPTAALTALLQFVTSITPGPLVEPTPIAGETPPGVSLPVDAPTPVVLPSAVVPTTIPVGLSAGLSIDPSDRGAHPVKPVVEPETNAVVAVPSFIVNTFPTTTVAAVVEATPRATTPQVNIPAEFASEEVPFAAVPVTTDDDVVTPAIVPPSFVTVTVSLPPSVVPVVTTPVTPTSQPMVVRPVAVSAAATSSQVVDAAPASPVATTVEPDSVGPIAPKAKGTEQPIEQATVVPTALTNEVIPATSPSAVLPPPPSAPPTQVDLPASESNRRQPLPATKPIPAPTPAPVHATPVMQTQETQSERTGSGPLTAASVVNAVPAAPSASADGISQPESLSAKPKPTRLPRPVLASHDTEDDTSDVATPSDVAAQTNVLPPVTTSAVAPLSSPTETAVPAPTVRPAAAQPAMIPESSSTTVPVTEAVPVPEVDASADERPPGPTKTTKAVAEPTSDVASAESRPSQITNSPVGERAAEPKPAINAESRPASSSGRPLESISSREELPTGNHLTAPPVRATESFLATPPALDFGDPVPIHQSQQLVQRLGDAIGLAQESGQHLSIRIAPPQFGPIVVNVHMHDGTVSARVETHSALAQQMLTDHLPQLHESLAARGAVIDRIDVIPVENRNTERPTRVEATSADSMAGGWMSSETSGGQGYNPQDNTRRRSPLPTPIQPATEPVAAEPTVTSRPIQLRELNVRV